MFKTILFTSLLLASSLAQAQAQTQAPTPTPAPAQAPAPAPAPASAPSAPASGDASKDAAAPSDFPSVAPTPGDLGVFAMAEGRILMVDLQAETITISHTGMSWNNRPAAVDVFNVRQRWLLNDLAPNQQVFFRAENMGTKMTITRLVSVF